LCEKLIRVEGLAVMGSEDLVERSEDTGGGSGKRVRERDLQKICEKDRREIVEAWLKELLDHYTSSLGSGSKKAVSSHIRLINWRAWGVL
jgi:hypothetical protein